MKQFLAPRWTFKTKRDEEVPTRLADETIKLWHYGPVALYQEFTDELGQKGKK